jgi:Ca2+-binding RTX toxin-like protein
MATILGTAGNDTIFPLPQGVSAGVTGGVPSDDPDSIRAGGGDDTIDGGNGVDTLFGEEGNDTVSGGRGDDSIDLGPGNDRFNWVDGDGDDTIELGGGGADTIDVPGGLGEWRLAQVGAVGGFIGGILFRDSDSTAIWLSGFGADDVITCFAEGTRIATARGEVPVEQLRAGDVVVTAHGGAPLQPLVWVGRTEVNVMRQRDKTKAAPVLIKAGALAGGVPHRDLRVSPEHAVFLDGRLVPARLLVNGTSIVQELWVAQVIYYHVELQRHSLVVSDGAVTESYFDDGNRHFFDNATVAALAVDFEALRGNGRYAEAACAPVVVEGEVVLEAIRACIAARATEQATRRRA